mmetsp:Transcript_123866/g.361707  ORF Transcript_123866/g.361707 Transcript_123866/m.361707 type:complete len:93 (+) Transcript_123866:444-722(+)
MASGQRSAGCDSRHGGLGSKASSVGAVAAPAAHAIPSAIFAALAVTALGQARQKAQRRDIPWAAGRRQTKPPAQRFSLSPWARRPCLALSAA